jgi:hypothetical protein
MVDGNASSSSHHEQVQAILVLKSRRVVDNQVEEKRTKQTRPLKKPNLANNKGVSNGVLSSATPTLETPYEPKNPFPRVWLSLGHSILVSSLPLSFSIYEMMGGASYFLRATKKGK